MWCYPFITRVSCLLSWHLPISYTFGASSWCSVWLPTYFLRVYLSHLWSSHSHAGVHLLISHLPISYTFGASSWCSVWLPTYFLRVYLSHLWSSHSHAGVHLLISTVVICTLLQYFWIFSNKQQSSVTWWCAHTFTQPSTRPPWLMSADWLREGC